MDKKESFKTLLFARRKICSLKKYLLKVVLFNIVNYIHTNFNNMNTLPLEIKLRDTLKPGDIFVSSWGYGQTNIDFYMVVKVHNQQADFVHLENKMVEDKHTQTDLCVVPYMVVNKDQKTIRRKVRMWVNERTNEINLSAMMSYSQYASKWDGTPKYETHPHYGH